MNEITLIMTHWTRHVDRFDYLIATVHSLLQQLPSQHRQHVIVGMEMQAPASPKLRDAASVYCKYRGFEVVENHDAPSIGTLMNLMLERVRTPYVLYFQDDFILPAPLPLDEDLAVLSRDNPYHVIRYSAHSRTMETAKSIPVPDGMPPLWEIQPDVYYYWSFNPFLANVAGLKDMIGTFPGGRTTEAKVNRLLREREQQQSQILVRGRKGGGGGVLCVMHIGLRTSILEKYEDEFLQRQFGDAMIPPRIPSNLT